MSYIIYYSDPSKVNFPIVVQDDVKYNSVGTGGLTLVGRNYPGYGQIIAENFIHLLENSASPVPPVNAIEGQLWYDSGTGKLRINDGVGNNTRWKPVNGIFQQSDQPSNVSHGDIWVDTNRDQIFIYNGSTFELVGPQVSSALETGSIPEGVLDINGNTQTVIINKVKGLPIEVISDVEFRSSGLTGFDYIYTGSNITNLYNAKYNGVAKSADYLNQSGIPVSGLNFVRNDQNQILNGQISIAQDGNALKLGINPTFILERENQYSANFVNTYPNYGEFNFKVFTNENIIPVMRIVGTAGQQGVRVLSDTSATTSATGALQVVGGVGIRGNLVVGGYAKIDQIRTRNGLGSDGNVLVADAGGLYWAPINTGTFATGGMVSGIFTISSYASATNAVSGALQVWGGVGIQGNVFIGTTTNATSVTNGALVVGGGLGVAKDLYVGGQIVAQKLVIEYTTITTTSTVVDDVFKITTVTNSISTTTGALQVAGGIGVARDLYVGGNVTVLGSVSGNNIISTTATNLASGVTGQIPYQVSPGITKFIGTNTAGSLLQMSSVYTATFVNTSSIYVNASVFAERLRSGLPGQLVYQTAASATSFLSTGTETDLLVSRPGAPAFESTSNIYVGFANMARQWQTSRTLNLGGYLSGSVVLDGTQDVTLTATINPNKVVLAVDTTGSYVKEAFTRGFGISGSAVQEAETLYIDSNATSSNIASTIVFRNAAGFFAASSASITTVTSTLVSAAAVFDDGARVWTTATLTDNSQLTNGSNYITPATLAFYGVTATVGTTYLGVSTQSGYVTFTNLGVQTLTAGTDTAVSRSTGTITVWATSTLQSVTARGASTPSAISITNNTPTTVAGTGALQVTGGIYAGAGLFITGAATVTNNLSVTGKSTLNGDITANAGMNLAGNFTATGVYAQALYDLGARAWTTATLTDNNQLTNGAGYLKTVTPLGGQSISVTAVSTSAPNTQFTINNTGVTGTIGTTYLGVSSPTGRVVLTNLGVQTLTAGTDTAVSASTGTVVVWNNATLESVSLRGAFATSIISLTNTVDATSTITGALKVSGGIGVGKNIYVGGALTVVSTATFNGSAAIQGAVTAYSFAGTGSGLTSIPNSALVNPSFLVTATGGVTVSTSSVALGGTLSIGYSGVSSITTGTGIIVSASTGNVVISSNDTLANVAGRGTIAYNTLTVNNVITVARPATRIYGRDGTVINSGTVISSATIGVSVDYDKTTNYSTSTGAFTVPYAGLYQVYFNSVSTNTAVPSAVALSINGATTGTGVVALWQSSTATVGTHLGVSTVAALDAGNTITARVIAGSITFDSLSNWGVCFIG